MNKMYLVVLTIPDESVSETRVFDTEEKALASGKEVHAKNFNEHDDTGFVFIDEAHLNSNNMAERLYQFNLDEPIRDDIKRMSYN